MKDIHVIGADYVQGSYQLLPEALDRVQASLHFADECGVLAAQGHTQRARWAYRAALGEFKSIFDVLGTDFRSKGFDKAWERSAFCQQLETNPLVRVLKKTRDLAIHTVKLPGTNRAVTVRAIDERGETREIVQCLFFDELHKSLAQRDMKEIPDDDVAYFNKQAKAWPADLLIRQAIYESSKPLAAFLAPQIRRESA